MIKITKAPPVRMTLSGVYPIFRRPPTFTAGLGCDATACWQHSATVGL
jgi:hypothetical protein